MSATRNKRLISRSGLAAALVSSIAFMSAPTLAQSLDSAHNSVAELLELDRQRALDAERKSAGLPTQSELLQIQQQAELAQAQQREAQSPAAQKAAAKPKPSTKVYVNAIYGVGDKKTVVAMIEDKPHVFPNGAPYAEGRPTNWRLVQVEDNCIKLVRGKASRKGCFEQAVNFNAEPARTAPATAGTSPLGAGSGIMQPPSPLM